MRKILTCAAMALMILLAWNADGAVSAQKKAPAKKTTAKKKTSTSKATTTKSASSHAKKPPPKRAVTWRNRQTSPSPDRYREIQTALASKGFLQPEDATGTWNQNSAEALKKFQADQNLESSGKINSLSLIALGLGPRHDTAPQNPSLQPRFSKRWEIGDTNIFLFFTDSKGSLRPSSPKPVCAPANIQVWKD